MTGSKNVPCIAMLGPSPLAFGGMASVTKAYQDAGLFDTWPIVQIDTSAECSRAKKLGLFAAAIAQIVWMKATGKLQALHVHVAQRTSFYRKAIFMLLARLMRVPYVVHMHGAEFDVFYEQECSPLAKRLVRFVLSRSAVMIVLGERWSGFFSSIVRNVRVVTIFNPVVLPKVVVPADQKKCDGVVLFLGELGARKGVPELLGALALIRHRVPAVKLQLCGNGDVQGFARRAEQLGLTDLVCFPGWVAGAEKDRLLSEATVLALPSHHEGLPMTILEAMGAGLPVISTPVGSIPEAIENGVEGFLVEAGDVQGLAGALVELLTNQELRVRMGTAARHKAISLFDAQRIVASVSNLYRQLGLRDSNGV